MAARRTFIVAAAQLAVRPAMADNARTVVRMIGRAAKRRARFLVTPEMFLTGYHGKFDQAERDRLIRAVIAPACARHRLTLILGAGTFRGRGKPFIHAEVIGPDGRRHGGYSKIVPTGGELGWCRAGHLSGIRPFNIGGLRFGITICNDFWCTPVFTTLPDPHLVERWAGKGAKAIFHLINSGSGKTYRDFHTTRMQERTALAKVWVISANAANDPTKPVNAPTGILGPDGRWRMQAPGTGDRLIVGRITC